MKRIGFGMLRPGVALALGCVLLAGGGAARAAVSFEVDRETLNDVLAELTLDEVVVPIAAGRSLKIKLKDLEVTGFDPTAGEHGQGYILTSVRLLAPDLGMEIPAKPRVSLNVRKDASGSLLELRFEEVKFSVPLAGAVNVARLLPPLRYPTDSVWILAGNRGDVPIASSLRKVEMGLTAIRFVFDVEVQSPPTGTAAPGVRLDGAAPGTGGPSGPAR